MFALEASNHKKKSSFAGGFGILASLTLVAGLAMAASPAQAASGIARDGKAVKVAVSAKTEVAVKDPEETGSIQASDDGLSCSQSRKRLFVEGEGWIVRKVTTCY